MTNGIVGKITAGGGTHLIASTAYGECNTSDSTPDKVATIKDADGNTAAFTLHKGVTVHIRMKYASSPGWTTLGVPLSLNVNGTGAKDIIRDTGNASQDKTAIADNYKHNGWKAGHILQFTYDGTYWVISGEPRPTDALESIQNNLNGVRLLLVEDTHTYLGYSDSNGTSTIGKFIRKQITFQMKGMYTKNYNPGLGNFYPIAFVQTNWNIDDPVNYPVITFKLIRIPSDTMSTVTIIHTRDDGTVDYTGKSITGYLYGLQVTS